MSLPMQILITSSLIFVAGFIDSIAGGGGLISLPAFNMVGLSPHMALGTNKFAACWGTLASTWQYVKSGKVFKTIVPVSIVCALGGSVIGTKLVLILDEEIVRWIMIILIPIIAVFTVIKKDFLATESQEMEPQKAKILAAIISLIIGCYDGFFGPGTGTFLMLAFVGLLKLDAVTAGGNAKVVNSASNIAAMFTYLINGKIIFALAVPAAICSMLGNHLGAKLAVTRGVKIIKPMLLVVVSLLLLTLLKDVVITAMAM